MKLFPFSALSAILAAIIPSGMAQDVKETPPKPPRIIDRTKPDSPHSISLRHTDRSRVIGEGGGARLLLHSAHDSRIHVNKFYHRLEAGAPDGRRFILSTGQSSSPLVSAGTNDRGDVAIPSYPGLKIFFAPDCKPVEIRKLRCDRFLKSPPKLTGFTISDLAWGQGMLVCSGRFHIAKDPSRPTRGDWEYPFVSRLFYDEKGEVRDHQILWTTWHAGLALPDKYSHSWRHHQANAVEGTFHVQGNLALWRNQGVTSGNHPTELPPGFEKFAWQCTDLTTGTTRPLAETDPVDRTRLEKIERKMGPLIPR